jgi:uncharacterized protein (TIRG00374 family)
MKPRTWLTLITLALLALVVALGWDEITRAWALLGKVNLWILALMLPVQILSYFASGEVMFTYLRSKGEMKTASRWQMARLSLELNFVNHILPSGITASFAYLGWVLSRRGVSAGRATIAQIIRHALTFVAYVLILVLSVVILAFSHQTNGTIIGTSAALIVVIIASLALVIYVTSSQKRLVASAGWVTNTVNAVVSALTFGKKRRILESEAVEGFFSEIHQDYCEIRNEKTLLLRPFLWAVALNCLDVMLLCIAFAALGFSVNPAIMVIAFGLSSVVSIASVAPGGAGVYETAMIVFLASAGVPADTAITGTLLARVVLFLGTIIFGYLFYQLTINKYGKAPI